MAWEISEFRNEGPTKIKIYDVENFESLFQLEMMVDCYMDYA